MSLLGRFITFFLRNGTSKSGYVVGETKGIYSIRTKSGIDWVRKNTTNNPKKKKKGK